MNLKLILSAVVSFGVFFSLPAYASEFTSKHLISKGGVIYHRGGDSTATIISVPKNVKDILQPGELIGFLPEDCISASNGALGDHYNCKYGLVLKPEERNGKMVYRVLDFE